ncbi:MAG: bifunctional riboflavin kinase/FAD synthetase [Verrucomicrobiae bacterium]|nr:bifunctional riboflavin kinase/FAD synthetase [Verrucomicrobiae bacterium]
MTIHHDIAGLAGVPGGIHCAIGVFDGVHLGHRAVIGEALRSAREGGGTGCVMTFDPHPARVLAPSSAPRLLTATAHKLNLIEDLGVGHGVIITFDREFAEMPAEDFVLGLHRAAGGRLARICVGADWRFGNRCRGDVGLLETMGKDLGFAVTGVPTVRVDGAVASSTRIREAVAGGDFAVAERLLGRPYTVLGTVVEGRKLGRTIGFPTANLRVHNEQLPPTGVYAVKVRHEAHEWGGVGNLGYRPTVEKDDLRRALEVHLFDFEGDLYGKDLEVRFVSFLRPEQKFDGLESLKAQIDSDAASARNLLE